MKICMFSRIMPAHSPGGMQDHVLALSTGLVKRGHAVTVITSGLEGSDHQPVDGVDIYYLQGTAPGRNSYAYWYGAADKFLELEPREHFDILHNQSAGAYGIYRKGLNRSCHLPLVTSLHGTHFDVLTTSWHTDFALTNPRGMARFGLIALDLLWRYIRRDLWLIRGSDVVIATSDADEAKYKKQYGLDRHRIRKVYNGIDDELFAPRDPGGLREELGIPATDKVILALARLEKDKGVQHAIEVMPRILQQYPAWLIVVGDGKYRSSLERLARERNVADHVLFVGAKSISECARYFNLCDVFVDPTLRTDGYDLTIAEAMACAKPAIASDVGANSTLVDAATSADGVLIPRGGIDALTCQVLRILADPELARNMGEHARVKIADRFSIKRMVESMERVYQQMIDEYKGRAPGQAT